MAVLGYGNNVGKVGGDAEGERREGRQENSVNMCCYFPACQEQRQAVSGHGVIQTERRFFG